MTWRVGGKLLQEQLALKNTISRICALGAVKFTAVICRVCPSPDVFLCIPPERGSPSGVLWRGSVHWRRGEASLGDEPGAFGSSGRNPLRIVQASTAIVRASTVDWPTATQLSACKQPYKAQNEEALSLALYRVINLLFCSCFRQHEK